MHAVFLSIYLSQYSAKNNKFIVRYKYPGMLNKTLSALYERDVRRFIDEINAFNSEENIWRIQGLVKNPSGNLALHIAGGLNHFFGALLAHNGYVRNRDLEFSKKGVSKKDLVAQLEAAIPVVTQALNNLTPEQMDAEFPIPFDGGPKSTEYVLVLLLGHVEYHLGQVNYLRRILE
jgi:hypothetical protein